MQQPSSQLTQWCLNLNLIQMMCLWFFSKLNVPNAAQMVAAIRLLASANVIQIAPLVTNFNPARYLHLAAKLMDIALLVTAGITRHVRVQPQNDVTHTLKFYCVRRYPATLAVANMCFRVISSIFGLNIRGFPLV
jgi:hypothetical protein